MFLQPEGQGTPSLSPTPSPAGSDGSVGSRSSGYSSGELANRGLANGQAPTSFLSVPSHVHAAVARQHYDLGLLIHANDKFDMATDLVTERHRGMFFFFT